MTANTRRIDSIDLLRGIVMVVMMLDHTRDFRPDYRFLGFFQVIWVIGVSMIFLAALIHLPKTVIAAFGLLLIALHNLTDGFRVVGWRGPGTPVPGVGAKLWILLHQQFDGFPVFGEHSPVLFVIYPLIPWIGVMAVGYVFGVLYGFDAQRRRRWLLIIGGSATLLFVVLRAINRYGDPFEWSRQKSFMFTVLSFINTSKYPPSLLFVLMTLGPAILLLALFEWRSSGGPVRNFFVTFGRVPLFFYLLQWFVAHTIAVLLHLAFGKPVGWLFGSPLNFGPAPQGIGFNLLVVYLSWIAGVLMLYPLCKCYAGVKQRRRDWWLSYL